MTPNDWNDGGNHVLGMLFHEDASEERDERGRPTGSECLLILLNGGPRSRSFTLPPDRPPGAWEEQLNTARAGARVVKTPAVNLVAHSLVLLRHRRV
jgi:pullulanase/glycogen debranching enzyme